VIAESANVVISMAEPIFENGAIDATYAAIVGARLRAVRRQKQLSLLAVQAVSAQEFKASVLGAYERGERAISVPRLQRLAMLYDVPVDQLLPEDFGDAPARSRAASETHPNGETRQNKVRIDLTRLREVDAPEAIALNRFLSTIRLERQDFNGQVLTIRSDDLRVIGAIFGLGVKDMTVRLQELGVIFVS
jgi:transcriptional regulator with XRE-family HTH domain